jgi:hypothetical protein
MGWFRNRSKASELEARLRHERPEPRPEFLQAVASRVDASRERTSLKLRVAFAAVLSLVLLVAVASVGGVGYAASGAQRAAQSVGNVFSPPANDSSRLVALGERDDAADNQYVKECRDAVKQKIKAEQELHKANMEAATTKAQKRAELLRHLAVMAALQAEKHACKFKGRGRGR